MKCTKKVLPRQTCYTIADCDVWGVEFDARFKGTENYSRLFFAPEADRLYLWKFDRRPEKFVKIPVNSISAKRKAALLEVWRSQPTEQDSAPQPPIKERKPKVDCIEGTQLNFPVP